MLKSTLLSAVLVAGIVMPLAGNVHAAGFVCAYKEAPNAPKDLPKIEGLQLDMSQLVAQNQLAALVVGLARAKVPPALIVDHLVWSYCPLVANDDKLTDAQKTDLVRRFASKVAAIVYANPNAAELDILVDVPIAPDLLVQIDAAAKTAGISRDEWINRAIGQTLAMP